MEFADLDFANLRKDMVRYFPASAIRRGDYFSQVGHVNLIKFFAPRHLLSGSIGEYSVEIFLDPSTLRIAAATCSCSKHRFCVHAAGFLFAVSAMDVDTRTKLLSTAPPISIPQNDSSTNVDNLAASENQTTIDAQEHKTATAPIRAKRRTDSQLSTSPREPFEYLLSERLRTQLAALVEAAAGSAERPIPGRRRDFILYIISCDNQFLLTVDLLCVFTSLAGERRDDEVTFTDVAAGKVRSANTDDLAIAALWHGLKLSTAAGSMMTDDAELIDLLLRRMIATNRCVYKSKSNPPLRLSIELPAKLDWIKDYRKHALRFCVSKFDGSNHIQILASASPWYVDERTWTAGKLLVDVPSGLLKAVLALPVLDASELMGVQIWLSQNAPPTIPRPLTWTPELEVRLVEPRISMRFETVRTSRGGQSDRVVVDVDFPGLPHGEPQERVQQKGQKAIILRPDLQALNKVLRQLEAGGFHEIRPEDKLDSNSRFYEPDSRRDLLRFLKSEIDSLPSQGCTVAFARNFRHTVAKDLDDWNVEVKNTGQWWFSLDIGISVNGERVPLLPILLAALKHQKSAGIEQMCVDDLFIAPMPNGRSIGIPLARLRPIIGAVVELHERGADLSGNNLHLSALEACSLFKNADLQFLRWTGTEKLQAASEILHNQVHDDVEPVAQPEGLKLDLRSYQLAGLKWLQFLRRHNLGGILADDMGLGKTIQTLAHLLVEHESGRASAPSLVICPTSVLPNWLAEAKRVAPSLKVLALRGANRAHLHAQVSQVDIVITTYSILVRDIQELVCTKWHGAILDESQAVKNPDTQLACAVYSLSAQHKICLTGTPVENHLGEIWSQFAFLLPGLLGSEKNFNKNFRTPIERTADKEVQRLLAERLRPVILRRTKEQVEPDLPAKETIIYRVPLEDAQRDMYEAVRLIMDERVQLEVAKKGWQGSQFVILKALLKLRQVCCHPQLLKVDAASSVPSAKLQALMEMLELLIEDGRSILVFSQFTSMLDIIKAELVKSKIQFVEITGDTKDRETPVLKFQKRKVPLFLLSLKAGGTGLNLTAADTVIHYDPWWNPAAEEQATDRAHRIGQTKPVLVYKLIAEDTVEERMLVVQERKRKLAESIFADQSGGIDAEPSFSEQDLRELLAPLT